MCELERIEPDVYDALASHADDYEVRGEIHRVPPHVTYEVVVDGTRAICKLATHPEADPATEGRLIEYVGANTSVPVPEVLAVGDDYFIAAWHDGAPQDTPSMDESLARTMGTGLATLHEQTPFGAPGFPRAGESGLEIDERETFHAVVCEFLAGLCDWLVPYGHDDAAMAALNFVRERPDCFAGCGDPLLCHGNYLADHVGVDDGEVTCVIDFEHALVGPGEYDFWRAAIPLRSNRGEEGVEAFRAGYESVRPLQPGFDDRGELFRLVNAVSYLQSLYLQGQHSPAETERIAGRMREFVFETVGTAHAGSV